jgi:small subunit ribosomal protein S4e
MSKKGPQRKNKAMSVSKSINVDRKTNTWAVTTKAGKHRKAVSAPIGMVLRDLLKITKTLKESKKILGEGKVKVDGLIIKNYSMGVGLFDIISIPLAKKAYRILIDKKGRIYAKEMEKDTGEKLCKIESKKAIKKAIQITTHDGRLFKGIEAKVGDTLKLKVPEGKIISVLPMKTGSKVYIIAGSHSGEKADVLEITPGTAKREKIIKLKEKDKEFETTAANVFVIGEGKEEIEELK